MGGTHYCFVDKISKMGQVEHNESDDTLSWRESQEIMATGIIFAFPTPMEKSVKMMTSLPMVP